MPTIQIPDADWPMLLKMVERGWADGDLAEYLEGDQINACERVLARLGISPLPSPSRVPDDAGHLVASRSLPSLEPRHGDERAHRRR
jgi:hypothetical protein